MSELGRASARLDRKPANELEDALTSVWPGELRTLLLRACLWDRARAERSWQKLRTLIGDPKPFFERDLTGLKGLLPLLHSAARRNEFSLDAKMWTYLRSAALREELRSNVYRDLCRDVLQTLVAAEVPVIALKACALAEIAYGDPSERHCHAIDLLVPSSQVLRAAKVVGPLGYRKKRIKEAMPGARQGLRHQFGLPLVIHTALFDAPVYNPDPRLLWEASVPAEVVGVPIRVLAPEHNLLHVLCAAFRDRARGNLRWAGDAWHILHDRRPMNWSGFVLQTRTSKLELPALTMLHYLVRALDVEVPDEVLDKLSRTSSGSTRPLREAALSGAIDSLDALAAAWSGSLSSPAGRRALLQFLLLPSGDYLKWRFGSDSTVQLPLSYVGRPLVYVGERLWWRALRLPGFSRFTYQRRVAAELARFRA